MRTSNGVTVDVQTLGEYQTSIARVRLTDVERQSVVWEVFARSRAPQLHEIVLSHGTNRVLPAEVGLGTYNVIVPEGTATFTLESGRNYRIEVWGKGGPPAVASFVL
jgi:hypothetical protein